jgi:hypothetical protein
MSDVVGRLNYMAESPDLDVHGRGCVVPMTAPAGRQSGDRVSIMRITKDRLVAARWGAAVDERA